MKMKNPTNITVSEHTSIIVKTIADIQHLSEQEVVKRALNLYKQYIRHMMSKDKMAERMEFFKFLRNTL